MMTTIRYENAYWRITRGETTYPLMQMSWSEVQRALSHPGTKAERMIVLTPYQFNKQMQDAYSVGAHGPIEVTLDDLLEDETVLTTQDAPAGD